MNPVATKAIVDLLHKCDAAMQIMLFCVPLRMIRVVAKDTGFKTFRVEQLVLTSRNPHDPRGTWAALSTHSSEVPGAAYQDAVEHALKAQQDLSRKLQRQADAQRPRLLVPA